MRLYTERDCFKVFPVISATGPSGKGEESEPWIVVHGRLYAAGMPCQRMNTTATHTHTYTQPQTNLGETHTQSMRGVAWL